MLGMGDPETSKPNYPKSKNYSIVEPAYIPTDTTTHIERTENA